MVINDFFLFLAVWKGLNLVAFKQPHIHLELSDGIAFVIFQ